ncbi:NUDIX hydrolase [Candidatus Saccharibacteria bacterium]|nr:NUDIX hydrolase [Candidatus Saccharibacteria bacterium]
MSSNIILNTQSNLDGEKITIEWRDLIGKRVPDIKWKQVHIIANYSGKVVLVYLDKLGMHHLPGGHVEEGEDIEATLRRELAEETGGIVIEWEPIGYQIRTDSKGKVANQLRVYAKVADIQSETIDIDGSLVPAKFVDVDEILEALGWKNPIGERIYELVSEKFTPSEESQQDLKAEADRMVEIVRPILEKYGRTSFVGGYEWGTMYDRDIDTEVWLAPDELKVAQKGIMSDLLNLNNVYEIKTRDLISFNADIQNGRNLKCILVMLKMFNKAGRLWNFDICLFDETDKSNNASPFNQDVLRKIEQMTDQQKDAVVDIKKAVTAAGLYLKGGSSVDIYLRVVEDGILKPEEYMPYAQKLADKRIQVSPKKRKKI